MIENIKICENCRKTLNNNNQLQYVEENSDRGFCSESCILDFYRPYMEILEKEEKTWREELSLSHDTDHLHLLAENHYLDNVLNSPHEVWKLQLNTGQELFTHISVLKIGSQDLFYIAVCTHYDNEPSFVYYRTITSSPKLLDKYRRNEKIVREKVERISDQNVLAMEIIEELENKKSSALAEMMMNRKDSDIPLEEFISFDKYLQLTLENPDEIYLDEDVDGDRVFIQIKSFVSQGESFFYVVVTLKYEDSSGERYLPVIGFPSLDDELYTIYAKGIRVDSKLTN